MDTLKARLAYYCNPVVNGDPQKAKTDGSVHRMEEQKNMYLDIPYLMIFLQEICRPDMDSG